MTAILIIIGLFVWAGIVYLASYNAIKRSEPSFGQSLFVTIIGGPVIWAAIGIAFFWDWLGTID